MVYPERELDSHGEVWLIVEHLERLAASRRPPKGMVDAEAYRSWLLRQIEGLQGLSESIEETRVLEDAEDRVAFASKEGLWREYTQYIHQKPSVDLEKSARKVSETEDRLNGSKYPPLGTRDKLGEAQVKSSFDPRFDRWVDLTVVGRWLGNDSHDPERNDWAGQRREHNRWMEIFASQVFSLWESAEEEAATSAAVAYVIEATKSVGHTPETVRSCLQLELGFADIDNPHPALTSLTDAVVSKLCESYRSSTCGAGTRDTQEGLKL